MTITDQQYQEEIDLIVSTFSASETEDLREDLPQKRVWLDETRAAKTRLQGELAELTHRERLLTAELLPDEERQRLAGIARDLRDGNPIGLDDEPTPCPGWCEVPEHDGEGQWHEGAMSEFEVTGPLAGLDPRVLISVTLNDDGSPRIDLQCRADWLTDRDAAAVIDGLRSAIDLYQQIKAER